MNNRGFTMMEVLIAMAIFVTIAYLSGGVFDIYNRQDKISANSATIIEIRGTYSAMIRDQKSWEATFNHASNAAAFACYASASGDCTAADGTTVAFRPFRADGTEFQNYNPTIPTQGFSPSGQLCNTFNAAAPDRRCPFRYTFRRTINCPTGPNSAGNCIRPTVQIQLNFDRTVIDALAAQGVKMLNINPAFLTRTIFRHGDGRTVTAKTCQPDEVVTQITANGEVICTNWNSL